MAITHVLEPWGMSFVLGIGVMGSLGFDHKRVAKSGSGGRSTWASCFLSIFSALGNAKLGSVESFFPCAPL